MIRVLIIEPDEELRVMLGRLLRRAGFDTVESAVADDCVRLLRKSPVDVIVMEPVAMQESCGELLDCIAERVDVPFVPVLILTRGIVNELEAVAHPAVKEGHQKPVSLNDLEDSIRRLAARESTL